MADDAGALLVRAGLITAQHLANARAMQAQEGGTLGEHLVAGGVVSDEALTEFYRSRLLVPQVNPNTLARLSTQVVSILPPDMALEFRAVPVSLDKDGNLTVAMSDPSDRHAVDEIAFFTSKYVVRAVATQMQIAWCLAQYYGYVTELGERLLQPVPEPPPMPAGSAAPAGAAKPAAPPPPKPAAPPPPAAPLPSRAKGDTARVEAARHRVLAPVTTPPPVQLGPRPVAESLERPPGAQLVTQPAPPAAPAKPPPAPPAPPTPSSTPTIVLQPSAASAAASAAKSAEAVLAAAWADTAKSSEKPTEKSSEKPTEKPTEKPSDKKSDDPFAASTITSPPPPPIPPATKPPIDPFAASTITAPPPPPIPPATKPPIAPPSSALPRLSDLKARAAENARKAELSKPSLADAEEITSGTAMVIEVDDPSGPIRQPPPAAATAAIAGAQPLPVAGPNTPTLVPILPPPIADKPAADKPAADKPAAKKQPEVVSLLHGDDPFAAPTVVVSPEASKPQRKRPAMPDPPELAARSGEMEAHVSSAAFDAPTATVEIHLDEDDAIALTDVRPRAGSPPPVLLEVDGDISRPQPLSDARDREFDGDTEQAVAIIHDEIDGSDSRPILLERPRRTEMMFGAAPEPLDDDDESQLAAAIAAASAAPLPARDEPSGPVLLLEAKKKAYERKKKQTVIGIGSLGPIPRALMPSGPTFGDAIITSEMTILRAEPIDDGVPTPMHDDDAAATRRHAHRTPMPDVDDGWGPPGTTIPPPFLGAVIPHDEAASGRIPVPGADNDSAPLLVRSSGPNAAPAPAAVPAATPPTGPTRPRALSQLPDAQALARQLEEASIRLVELLRSFDGATSRDQAIKLLVEFVTASHHRAAFLAAKNGRLTAFMQVPANQGAHAEMSLDVPSTFQDVVGTRLPYRGPISDPPSRELVKAMFGSTTDEMLAVPVAIRDRVIGVIYADGRHRHTFDEHVAVACRAAGLALERVLKSKKH